jgi:hypothetical protein
MPTNSKNPETVVLQSGYRSDSTTTADLNFRVPFQLIRR